MLDDLSPWTFWFYKTAKEALSPWTWIVGAMIATVVLLFGRQTDRRLRLARITAGSGLVLFYALSAGPLSPFLAGMLEQAYPPYHMEPGQSFDAIVVLAGGMRAQGGVRPTVELQHSTMQRVMCGAEAYEQGLSPTVLMSGSPDAEEMARLAARLAVPRQALARESFSRNTYESAKEVRQLLGDGARVLLVTSAIHLPRSLLLFRKQGLQVTPYPCGYRTRFEVWTFSHSWSAWLVPQLGKLEMGMDAVNEFFGLAIYRAAGKL